ncbi:MAG: hypothetical protein Q8878_04835 [Bacillota bacterium]|nr:hypothetical protein [Bacillota bacterium]
MTVTEKAAYLKGLMAGLNLNSDSNESKLFTAIADLLEDISISVQDLEEITGDLGEELDDLSADLTDLEDEVYGEDDECHCHDEPGYEVTCPTCGEVLYVDDSVIDDGTMNCPSCGEELEFDLSGLDENEEENKEDK